MPIYITTTALTVLVILYNSFSFICLHNIVFHVLIDFKAVMLHMHQSTILSLKCRLQKYWFLLRLWHVYIKSGMECQVQAFCYRWRALLSAEWVFRDESWWQRLMLCPNDISSVHSDETYSHGAVRQWLYHVDIYCIRKCELDRTPTLSYWSKFQPLHYFPYESIFQSKTLQTKYTTLNLF